MDIKLEKALDNLHKHLKARKPNQEIIQPELEEALYKPKLPEPSPRDQQDLMSFPFFSLSKNKRTEPIIYEQGNIKVFIEGLPSVGVATIWDADFLIWVASQLNAAIEAGEQPSRRLWVVPYHFPKGYPPDKP